MCEDSKVFPSPRLYLQVVTRTKSQNYKIMSLFSPIHKKLIKSLIFIDFRIYAGEIHSLKLIANIE